MIELALSGCRAEPIGSYLKALGVLRLVGGQLDPEVSGAWVDELFHLRSDLDRPALLGFFLRDYRPTPLVAPWNGGSGFGEKDQRSGIEAIEESVLPRLQAYRASIRVAREIRDRQHRLNWNKAQVVEICRASLPDEALEWLDAAVVLGESGLGFPPLLGSGGNLGRLELSNSFMQRLAEVLCLRAGRGAPTPAVSEASLQASLFGAGGVPSIPGPVGQFDPGAAGGANSSPLGAADSLVNPWDFVLLLEGALVFASAASRRLSSGSRGKAAVPFTFDGSPVGYSGAADAESSKGEVWAPLWSRFATAREISHLIGEGRSEWRGRQAARGVDMVRAAASLGVDRGVTQFVRHAFVERFGQSTLAVAVGRVEVRARPEVPHLAALDPWLDRARRGRNPPATVSTGLRRLDAAMFALATRGGSLRLQEVLAECAAAELAVGRATAFRSAPPSITPISELPASDWVPLLDDGSAEFRVACALASLHDDDGACLRWMLRAVGSSRVQGRLEWSERPPAAPGLGVRPLCRVLGDALARRAVEVATRAGDPPRGGSAREEGAPPGATMAFGHRLAAPATDVVALVAGELDEDRVGRLLGGLMLLDWRRSPDVSHWFAAARREPLRADPAWAVLAPFFHGRPIALRGESVHLRPEGGWASQLAAGRVEPVVGAAIRRLRMARLDPAIREDDAPVIARAGPPGHRLAAALLCPIPGSAVAKLLRRVVPPPLESEKEDTR